MRRLVFYFRLFLLGLLQRLLFRRVTLCQCLRLRLVLLLELLRVAAGSGLLRGLRVISGLLLLEFLPLLLLTVAQVVLLSLIRLVACGISRARFSELIFSRSII